MNLRRLVFAALRLARSLAVEVLVVTAFIAFGFVLLLVTDSL